MENETPGKESMRIMQETKIFIISNEYRNAITKIAAENHHFLIHTPKANANQVKELLPDYEVIELNPMKHAIDYFSLITNKQEAKWFVDLLIQNDRVVSDSYKETIYDEMEKQLLVNAIEETLARKNCSFKNVFELLNSELKKSYERSENNESIPSSMLRSYNDIISKPEMNEIRFRTLLTTCLLLIAQVYNPLVLEHNIHSECNNILTDCITKLKTETKVAIVMPNSPVHFVYEDIMLDIFIWLCRKYEYFDITHESK